MEHEASTSKIGEDQIFYLQQRGSDSRGCRLHDRQWILQAGVRELPMEFAVEAQKLLGVSLEGSVG